MTTEPAEATSALPSRRTMIAGAAGAAALATTAVTSANAATPDSLEMVSEGRTDKVVRETFTGDRAIVTVPFSGLRHIPVAPALSYGKRRAITEIHYDAATKVLLEFSRR